MEGSRMLQCLLLLFVTSILSSHGGDAKGGDVDMDIVNKLKESGALDDIKEELEKMLDAKEGSNDRDIPVAMAYAHVEEYVKQNQLKVTEGLMKAMVNMPSASDSQAKHFTVLDDVASSIDRLLTKGPNVNEKLNAEISDSLIALMDKFKSVEELRNMFQAQQKAQDLNNKKPQENKKEENKYPNVNPLTGEGLTPENIVQAVNMFMGLVKTNPDMIVDYVTKYLETNEYFSPKVLKMAANYGKNFAKTPYFAIGIDYIGSSITELASTPSGQQMLELIPTLANPESRDTIADLVKAQAESKWESFFNAINNSDLRDEFLMRIATVVEYIHAKILMDDMKMMMANAFLLTQNLPPITPRRLLPSVVDLVTKCVKKFSPVEVDMTLYETLAKDLSNHFASEYVSSSEFAKLKENERIRVVTTFLEENVVLSAMELWKAHNHVFGKGMPMMALDTKDKTPRDITRNLHCAENLLCNINANSRKETSMIRKTTSKGLSLGMAWVWGNTGLLEQSTLQLYTALHNGADIFKSVDCDEKYAVSDPESCKIFDWQTDKMSLSFDSKELPKTKKKQPVPETTQEKPPKHEEL